MNLDLRIINRILLSLVTRPAPQSNSVEETDFSVNDILDPLCSWTADCGASGGVATKLYDIADKCLKRNKRTRPSMADVIAMIQI